MPGPLVTYTIARTLRTTRRGWLIGARVIASHASIESLLVCGLVLGVVEFLRAPLAVKIIAVVGAALLMSMGVGPIRETVRGRRIDLEEGADPSEKKGNLIARLNPVLAGALVSMSNPYWWIWWVTIGSAFLVRYEITLARWQTLIAFFIGHEMGDFGLVFGRLHFPPPRPPKHPARGDHGNLRRLRRCDHRVRRLVGDFSLPGSLTAP